ncbi:MAG: hypothetical protein HFF14_00820 [Angelakisella sp.]|nr:hypothetical protein [Angelakisella sp.]
MTAKGTGIQLFDQAVAEVAESGDLSFPTRRQLWLALGEWEWRDEDDPEETPRALTEALKKRAGLAWACAKKVMPVWSAYAPNDKAPQKLLKAARDYLDGRIPAETLEKAMKEGGFLDRAEDEPYSTAPAAAMAAWQAAWAAWLDEPLLAQRYAGASDSELDYDDWDAAHLAAIAWSGRDEEAQPGERAVQWMRFWVWYLEQLAPLLGIETFRFPKKAITVFKEKQFPVKPLPEEVTVASFCDYIGAGDYLYHTWNGRCCEIVTRMRGDHAVCPKTKEECRQLVFYYGVRLLEDTLPGDHPLTVAMWVPLFHCDVHPGNSHAPRGEYANPKANCQRYLAGEGRAEAFLQQIREQAANVFVIGQGYTTLNGEIEHHHNVRIPAGVPGIRWADWSTETLEIDLEKFGPHVYFPDCNWKDLRRLYPNKAVPQEDGSFLLEYERHWVRCYPDEAGKLRRVTITSRFKLEVEKLDLANKNQEKYNPGKRLGWVKALRDAFDLTTAEARAWVEDPGQPWRKRFDGLTRREAERLQTALRSHGVKCRIMPWRVGVPGDTMLK